MKAYVKKASIKGLFYWLALNEMLPFAMNQGFSEF